MLLSVTALHIVTLCALHPTRAHAGVGPQSTPVMLPDLSSRLSHMEQSVSLLMSGAPLPADMQRADASTKVPILLLCTLLALLLRVNALLQHCCCPAVLAEGLQQCWPHLGAQGGGGGVCKVIQLMLLHLQLRHLDIMQTRPFVCKPHSR